MKEILAKVYVEDEQYLVDSRETPGRKRGQTRDANNKDPHFPEMEIIDEGQYKNEIRRETLQEVQADQAQMRHRENMIQQQIKLQEREIIRDAVYFGLDYLRANPQIVDFAVEKTCDAGKTVVRRICKGAEVVWKGIWDIFSSKDEPKADLIITPSCETPKIKLTEEEARYLVIETVESYLTMKRNVSILSNSVIDGFECPKLDFEQVIIRLNECVYQYPMIANQHVLNTVGLLLEHNDSKEENERIMNSLTFEARKAS